LREVGRGSTGTCIPESKQERETRVICRIHPRRIVLDAIHGSGAVFGASSRKVVTGVL
jgi:hypothetical protein